VTLLFDFLLISGLVFNAIILVLLWQRRERTLPDRLLMGVFGATLVEIIHIYGGFHDLDVLEVITYPLDDLLAFWLGPLLLMYVKSLYQPSAGLVRRHWPHFAFMLVYFGAITAPVMVSIFRGGPIFSYLTFLVKSDWFYIVHMLYLMGYALWSLRLLRRYRTVVKDNFSELDTYGFDWVRHFFQGVVLVIIIDLSTSFYELTFGELSWSTGYLTIGALVVLIAYLGVHGVSQSKVLLPDFLLARTQDAVEVAAATPTTPSTPLPEAADLAKRLQAVLTEEEAYLDEALTLGKLAALLPCTDKKLSLLLNQHLGTSFYDLINERRIAAVQDAMAADPYGTRSIIEIAYTSGFKSKTSFNRVFKQRVGMTPGAYRENLATKT